MVNTRPAPNNRPFSLSKKCCGSKKAKRLT